MRCVISESLVVKMRVLRNALMRELRCAEVVSLTKEVVSVLSSGEGDEGGQVEGCEYMYARVRLSEDRFSLPS